MTVPASSIWPGKPGSEYDQTRHNAGALFVERLAHAGRQPRRLTWYFGLVGKFSTARAQDVRLLIPTTYADRSGQSVAFGRFFRIALDRHPGGPRRTRHPGVASSRPAVDTAGTTGCAISSPSSAINSFHRLRLGISIRAPSAWFPVTCSPSAPRAASLQELLDTSIDFASASAEMLARDWTRSVHQLHSQKASTTLQRLSSARTPTSSARHRRAAQRRQVRYLFNALTKSGIAAESLPVLHHRRPNSGIVPMPDSA